MAGAKLEKTRWPGIYRRGDRWAYEWTDAAGKRRRGSADTREDASSRKAAAERDAARGEFGEAGSRSRITLAAYALDLFGATLESLEPGSQPLRGRYQGRKGAVRDSTRADYRSHLERTWLPRLGARPLAKLTAPEIGRVVGALAALDGHDYLADSSIRRVFAPLSALLATAVEEGHVPYNVARDVRLPSGRDALRRFDADDEDGDDPAPGKARALTRDQLAAFLLVVDPRWRILFELLAVTGLRISEALALRWTDLRLDGAACVKVRRAYVRGVYGPPKSKHGRRDVPVPFALTRALRERRSASEWPGDRDLVFPSLAGTPMDAGNLYHRTLKPAAEEAGAAWAGFHAFRHYCASALISEGRNILQVSRWLGHHSASFTLDTYAHLMDEGVGQPLEMPANPSTHEALTRANRAGERQGSAT
jgi:integrase